MPIELRSWINPQSYSNSYSTAPIAREATAEAGRGDNR
jgi:hypothetical protein